MGSASSGIMSMTGFGRASGQAALPGLGDAQWHWEVKSVNAKGLDLRARVPSFIDGLDIDAKRLMSKQISRGSVSAFLEVSLPEGAAQARIDSALLDQMIALAGDYDNHENLAPSSLAQFLAVRGVVDAGDVALDEEQDTALRADVLAGLDDAVRALNEARAQEGAAMRDVVSGLIADLDTHLQAAKACDGARLEAIRTRFREKVADMMEKPAEQLNQERLEQEIATLAVKADIREEMDRLDAHIAAARALLAENGPIGRKFDFLSQELNREANTICSKSGDMDLTQTGLAMKATIDQLREQIQNIE